MLQALSSLRHSEPLLASFCAGRLQLAELAQKNLPSARSGKQAQVSIKRRSFTSEQVAARSSSKSPLNRLANAEEDLHRELVSSLLRFAMIAVLPETRSTERAASSRMCHKFAMSAADRIRQRKLANLSVFRDAVCLSSEYFCSSSRQ